MIAAISDVPWLAILVSVVVGQVFLTVWFAVIFAQPWARAYGVADKTEHTRQIPGYTYAVGAACVLGLSLGLAGLQTRLGVGGVAGGLEVGLYVALLFCVATALPGYAFLRRWNAFSLAIGAQATLILILSTLLAVWPRS